MDQSKKALLRSSLFYTINNLFQFDKSKVPEEKNFKNSMMTHPNHGPGDLVILTNGNGITNGNGFSKTNGNGYYENGNGNDLDQDPEELVDLEEQEIAAKLIQVKFQFKKNQLLLVALLNVNLLKNTLHRHR